MEISKFERNSDLGETIYVKEFMCSLPSLTYPVKGGITSDTDIENMNMMIEAEKRGGGIS